MRHFAGLALNDDRIPDESTILQFRHLLERQHLTQGLFEAVQRHLRERGYHLSKGTMVDATLKQRNRRHSRVRARVAHVFRIIKCQFGYRKVRYKGLAKNRAQVMSLVALANLYLLRRSLMAA